MSLKDKVTEDTKVAAKKKDLKQVKVLRFFHAAIKNKEIELRPNPIKETDVISVLKKQIKQGEESLGHYKKAEGYESDVKEEEYKLSILKSYLPKLISKDELNLCVENVFAELKPQSVKDMGNVMKAVMEKTKGLVDGKALSQMVRDRLNNL